MIYQYTDDKSIHSTNLPLVLLASARVWASQVFRIKPNHMTLVFVINDSHWGILRMFIVSLMDTSISHESHAQIRHH